MLTARCYESTCAIVFANAAGPADTFLGLSRVVLPGLGCLGTMSAEQEGCLVVELDIDIVRLAEENYRVRRDITSESWHYSYRHNV